MYKMEFHPYYCTESTNWRPLQIHIFHFQHPREAILSQSYNYKIIPSLTLCLQTANALLDLRGGVRGPSQNLSGVVDANLIPTNVVTNNRKTILIISAHMEKNKNK